MGRQCREQSTRVGCFWQPIALSRWAAAFKANYSSTFSSQGKMHCTIATAVLPFPTSVFTVAVHFYCWQGGCLIKQAIP